MARTTISQRRIAAVSNALKNKYREEKIKKKIVYEHLGKKVYVKGNFKKGIAKISDIEVEYTRYGNLSRTQSEVKIVFKNGEFGWVYLNKLVFKDKMRKMGKALYG